MTEKDFDRQLMDIAYMGAFYGLTALARHIFDHYATRDRGCEAAHVGRAFACIVERKYREAATLLEEIVDGADDGPPEAAALLALACRLGSFSSGRDNRLAGEPADSDIGGANLARQLSS